MYLMLSTKAITLLYALLRHIFCQLFSMDKNFRCATLRLLLARDLALSRQVAVDFISGSIYPVRDREKLTSACNVSIKMFELNFRS